MRSFPSRNAPPIASLIASHKALTKLGACPVWMELLVNNLLKGGVAWADAEKMKIADLNWRITVIKPTPTH